MCIYIDCPIDGDCLSESLIYKVSVTTTTNKYYYGTCENTFKNVTITIKVLLEINLVEKMFVDLERKTYAFVRCLLLQQQILMFSPINVISFSQK